MKNIITVLLLCIGTVAFSQSKSEKATIEVDGVCMMCKQRIEKAAIKTKGVKSAIWNVDTHQLSLIYDGRKTNVETISNKVASVGHDTKVIKASDEAYNSVHACCKYRDDDVKKDHEVKQ